MKTTSKSSNLKLVTLYKVLMNILSLFVSQLFYFNTCAVNFIVSSDTLNEIK